MKHFKYKSLNLKNISIQQISDNAGSFVGSASQLIYTIIFVTLLSLAYMFYTNHKLFVGIGSEPIIILMFFVLLLLFIRKFDEIISLYYGLSSFSTYFYLLLWITGMFSTPIDYNIAYDWRALWILALLVPQAFRIINYIWSPDGKKNKKNN